MVKKASEASVSFTTDQIEAAEATRQDHGPHFAALDAESRKYVDREIIERYREMARQAAAAQGKNSFGVSYVSPQFVAYRAKTREEIAADPAQVVKAAANYPVYLQREQECGACLAPPERQSLTAPSQKAVIDYGPN
ncbi:MAG: hypothetical protein WDO70_02675 [Alphaproteobacteria bacterium]